MTEKEQLQKEIEEIDLLKKPKEERLRQILSDEEKEIKERVNLAKQLKASFRLDELVFSAGARCSCGAGLAYPKGIGGCGQWTCSDILLGRAKPSGDPDAKTHDGDLPFAFYEVKSENQPSAYGQTTRPKE
jgi:hypothetical protein